MLYTPFPKNTSKWLLLVVGIKTISLENTSYGSYFETCKSPRVVYMCDITPHLISISYILQIDLITESKKWKTGSKHWKKRKINCRINPPEKSILKICIKFIGEHPCRSVISVKLQNNFIEITLRHGCSPVNLLHIFKTHCLKNTPGGLLLNCQRWKSRS